MQSHVATWKLIGIVSLEKSLFSLLAILHVFPQQSQMSFCPDISVLHVFAACYCIEEGFAQFKLAGMLVVSLRGVNFRFWFHLCYSGHNAIMRSRRRRDLV